MRILGFYIFSGVLFLWGALGFSQEVTPKELPSYGLPKVYKIERKFSTPSRSSYCREQYPDSPKHEICEFSHHEAEVMAAYWAGGHARAEGLIRGYMWALFHEADLFRDDPQEIDLGQAAVERGKFQEQLRLSLQDVKQSGAIRGQEDASHEVVKRYREAVSTQMEPSSEVNPVIPNIRVAMNPYYEFIGNLPTPGQILTDELGSVGGLPVYTDYWNDEYMGRPQKRLELRHLYRDGGVLPLENDWESPKVAYQAWLERKNIKNKEYRWNQTNEKWLPLTTNDREFFKKTFYKSYLYYSKPFIQKMFWTHFDLGLGMGSRVGRIIGKKIARAQGEMMAFNEKYFEEAEKSVQSSYLDGYQEGYSRVPGYYDTFEQKFTELANRSEIVLNFKRVTQADPEDEILQPGEKIGIDYDLENYGGKGTRFTVDLSGPLVENASVNGNWIDRISKKNFLNSELATLSSLLEGEGELVDLLLSIRDEYDNKEFRVKSVKVTRIVNLIKDETLVSPMALQGASLVRASVQNMSARDRTPSAVELVLFVDGKEMDRKQLGVLKAREFKSSSLEAQIDPLRLIQGKIKGKVVLQMGGVSIQSQEVLLGLKASAERNQALAKYWDQEIRERQDVSRLSSYVLEQLEKEILLAKSTDGNYFKNRSETTLAGNLALAAVKTVQEGKMQDVVQNRYKNLYDEMWSLRKKMRLYKIWGLGDIPIIKVLFQYGFERKAYESEVRRIKKTIQ